MRCAKCGYISFDYLTPGAPLPRSAGGRRCAPPGSYSVTPEAADGTPRPRRTRPVSLERAWTPWLPPNESRLSGGQANPPGAQLLHYLILDCPAPQPRLARRCRRWLGSGPELAAFEDLVEGAVPRTPYDGGHAVSARRILEDRDTGPLDLLPDRLAARGVTRHAPERPD